MKRSMPVHTCYRIRITYEMSALCGSSRTSARLFLTIFTNTSAVQMLNQQKTLQPFNKELQNNRTIKQKNKSLTMFMMYIWPLILHSATVWPLTSIGQPLPFLCNPVTLVLMPLLYRNNNNNNRNYKNNNNKSYRMQL